jgi:hypothetical protein
VDECKPLGGGGGGGEETGVSAEDVETFVYDVEFLFLVRRCRLSVSTPVLTAPMVSALETILS